MAYGDGITVKFAADYTAILQAVEEITSQMQDVAASAAEVSSEMSDSLSGVDSVLSGIGETVAGVAGDMQGSFSEVAASASEVGSSLSDISSQASSLSEISTEASSISESLSGVGTAASDAAAGLSGIAESTSSIAEVSDSLSGIDTGLSQVATTAQETASSVETSMSEVGTSADEAASQTKQAGESGGSGFMAGMSQVGMTLFAIQGGVNMVQNAFQQATGPFGNFQEQMTQLVTGAGESQSALAGIQQGIENMSIQTGTSTDQLAAGMYMIESAGIHGAAGLKVLLAATEGAKVGGADLETVANALTSALNAYHLPASQAASVTNQLIATVAAGKMHMQDLANALAAVLPVAAAAGISYAQIGGAIATMTAQGTSAQQATQNLANTIRSLQSPNQTAINEMQQMGLNSNQVAMSLGKKGLTGTLEELTQAVTAHMGPAGTVLMNTFNSSKVAAQDANQMISAMPSSLQSLAKQYLAGSVSAKTWRTDLQGLDPIQQKLMTQFAATADKTHSFNSLLTSGSPAAQTYTAALSKMLGGSTGLNTALQLTGTNMSTFQANVNAVSDASKKGGSSITGWSLVQQDFNQKMAVAAAQANVFMINLGQKLAPVIITLMGDVGAVSGKIGQFIGFMSGGSVGATAIKAALAGIAVAIGVAVIPAMVTAGITAVATFGAWALAQIPVIIGTLAIAAPYILIGAIVAAVVFGIIEAIQHWGAISAWLKGAWSSVIDWIVTAFHNVESFFVGIFNRLKPLFIALGIIMAIAFAPLIIAIAAIAAPFVGLFLLFTHFHQVLQLTQSIARVVWQAILNAILAPIHLIGAAFEWLYAHNTYFQKLVDAIRSILTAGINWIRGIWEDVIGWIVSRWDYLKAMATIYFMMVYVEIQSKIQQVENFIHSIWEAILSYLQGRWQVVVSLAQSLWGKVTGVFQAAWSGISGALHSLWTNIVNFVSGWPAQAVQWGVNLIKGLINGILSMVGGVGNAVGQIAGKIGSFLGFHSPTKEGPGAESDTWGPAFVTMFADSIQDGLPTLQAALVQFIQPMIALGGGGAPALGSSSSLQGNSGGGSPTVHNHFHVYLDGDELGSAIAPHVATNIIHTVMTHGPVKGKAA